MEKKEKILQLKRETGLGIAKCKQAIEAADGNLKEAHKQLVEEARKIAAKLADHPMPEGTLFIFINPEKTQGALLDLGCETDFVANSAEMKALGQAIIEAGVKQGITMIDSLLQTALAERSIADKIVQLIGAVKENIAIRDYQFITAPLIAGYVHNGNQKAALVTFDLEKSTPALQEAATAIATHVAVFQPQAIHPADLQDGDTTAALMRQTFLYEESQTVQEYLDSLSERLTVTDFKARLLS